MLPPPTAIQLPEYWRQGCLVPQSSPTPKECVYGDTAKPVLTVALVGDSIAGNWFAPLEQIAVKRHWRLVTDLHSACPLSATMTITPNAGGAYTACRSWGTAVLHDLETTVKPDVVITSDLAELATVAHPGRRCPPAQADIGAGMEAGLGAAAGSRHLGDRDPGDPPTSGSTSRTAYQGHPKRHVRTARSRLPGRSTRTCRRSTPPRWPGAAFR